MSELVKYGFEFDRLTVLLENILPVRSLDGASSNGTRFPSIALSIQAVGLVEPLIICRRRGLNGKYELVDGHLRYYALMKLGYRDAECLMSTDDESYTYNARISRLSPIQEHSMISRAVKNGVDPERIAAALNRSVGSINSSVNLLEGLDSEAVELLKTKKICASAIKALKQVTPVRQIEMAELMCATANFTGPYARALLAGTKADMVVQRRKKPSSLTAEDAAKMEAELQSIEKDFKALEASYGDAVMNLTVARRYIQKLVDNARVKKFLETRYGEILTEFQAIAVIDAL